MALGGPLGDARLVGFVGVTDLGEARRFYGGVLGLDLADESPFALVATAGTASLRLTAVERTAAAPYTVAGWTVDDVAATVAALADRGVEFVRHPGLDQDERGVWTAPGGTRVAWFRDPDGNTLSVQEHPA